MKSERSDSIQLHFASGRPRRLAPRCFCFTGSVAVGVIDEAAEVPSTFASKWAQHETQRDGSPDESRPHNEGNDYLHGDEDKDEDEAEAAGGVNNGGRLVYNVVRRLEAIMDRGRVEELVFEGMDKGLLPRTTEEESLLFEVFMIAVKEHFPGLDPGVEGAIRRHCALWLNTCFFHCSSFSSALCYRILDYLFHAGYASLINVALGYIQAVLAFEPSSEKQARFIEGASRHSVLDSSVLAAARSFAVNDSYVDRKCLELFAKKLKVNQVSMQTFSQFKWVGFDLDHTLIDYARAEEFMFYSVLRRLREVDDFIEVHAVVSEEVIAPVKYRQFSKPKGFFVDAQNGNILFVASNGKIDHVLYGQERLSHKEANAIYPKRVALTDNTRFIYAHTRFESVFPAVVSFIATKLESSQGFDWTTFIKKLKTVFVYVESKFCYYGLGEALAHAPGRFCRKQPKVVKLLKRLRESGIKILLLTNAQFAHTENMMSVAYGSKWKNYFDLIACSAKKKSFFSLENETPLTAIPLGGEDIGKTIYCGGSFHTLQGHLEAPVLYFGDHFYEDIIASNERGWSPVAVAEMFKDHELNPLISRCRQPSWLYHSVEGKAMSFISSLHMMAKAALKS